MIHTQSIIGSGGGNNNSGSGGGGSDGIEDSRATMNKIQHKNKEHQQW